MWEKNHGVPIHFVGDTSGKHLNYNMTKALSTARSQFSITQTFTLKQVCLIKITKFYNKQEFQFVHKNYHISKYSTFSKQIRQHFKSKNKIQKLNWWQENDLILTPLRQAPVSSLIRCYHPIPLNTYTLFINWYPILLTPTIWYYTITHFWIPSSDCSKVAQMKTNHAVKVRNSVEETS